MTIHQILAHPDYERFAAEVTDTGRCVFPCAYPWKYMGMTDAAFFAQDIKLETGVSCSALDKVALLGVVRANEVLVETYWRWWQAWQRRRALIRGEQKEFAWN